MVWSVVDSDDSWKPCLAVLLFSVSKSVALSVAAFVPDYNIMIFKGRSFVVQAIAKDMDISGVVGGSMPIL